MKTDPYSALDKPQKHTLRGRTSGRSFTLSAPPGVSILESINIVSSKTSTTLQRQLETQQQYSRRNCMVKQEDEASLTAKVTKIVETLEPGCHAELDKVHRIGPIKDSLQSTIVSCTKHSTITKIFNKRKSQNSYLFQPSLTNFRRKELKKANNVINGSRDKSFVFADILGNLKARFEKPLKGRYVHEFYEYLLQRFDGFNN